MYIIYDIIFLSVIYHVKEDFMFRKEIFISHLSRTRDMIVEALAEDLTVFPNEEHVRGYFVGELNMIQFIIENIDNYDMLDDNPYFHKWLDEKIKDLKTYRDPIVVQFILLKQQIQNRNLAR